MRMIQSLHIENLRGIRSLKVEGLDRVNLVIGQNDAGKTSFMGGAAFSIAPASLQWASQLGHARLAIDDVERVWRPLFRGGDSSVPIRLIRTDMSGAVRTIEISMARTRPGGSAVVSYREDVGTELSETFECGSVLIKHQVSVPTETIWWSGPYPDSEGDLIDPLKELYTSGRMQDLVAAARIIHPGIERVDLVGDAVYVVLAGFPLPLPLSVLGDGARRLLEFAIPVAMANKHMFIDEIENGFHWSALGKVWDFLRTSRLGQIFATTHREENIRIACETFLAAGDDSLRIVRLHLTEGGHRAVVYRAGAALAALDSGLEIRG